MPIVGYCFGIRSERGLGEEVDLNPVNSGWFAQNTSLPTRKDGCSITAGLWDSVP